MTVIKHRHKGNPYHRLQQIVQNQFKLSSLFIVCVVPLELHRPLPTCCFHCTPRPTNTCLTAPRPESLPRAPRHPGPDVAGCCAPICRRGKRCEQSARGPARSLTHKTSRSGCKSGGPPESVPTAKLSFPARITLTIRC